MSNSYQPSDSADMPLDKISGSDTSISNASQEALAGLDNLRNMNSGKNTQLSSDWPDLQIVDSGKQPGTGDQNATNSANDKSSAQIEVRKPDPERGMVDESKGSNYTSRTYKDRSDSLQRRTTYDKPIGEDGLKSVEDYGHYKQREYQNNKRNGILREFEYRNPADGIDKIRYFKDGTSESYKGNKPVGLRKSSRT